MLDSEHSKEAAESGSKRRILKEVALAFKLDLRLQRLDSWEAFAGATDGLAIV